MFNKAKAKATAGSESAEESLSPAGWLAKGAEHYDAENYETARECWERAAEQNNAEALFNLGCLYDQGHGVDLDYDQARQYYERAAEQNHARAFNGLGVLYAQGHGVAQDYDQARQYYERAAEQNDVRALFNLGSLYNEGHGVDQDYSQAREYWEQAAEQNDVTALFYLGVLYDQGHGVDQDYSQAREYWEQPAEQDHAQALFNLGSLYNEGHGVDQDYSQARQYYERAAEQNNAEALFNLGCLYDQGHGVDLDYDQARQYYERAAEQNDADAFFNLGRLYARGYGVARDYGQARQYYERAAGQNHAEAFFNLGLLYYRGDGVEQDYSQARQYYERAAEQNDADALVNLGYLYDQGYGVARDYGQARQYYERAAEQNHVRALSNLASLYQEGCGVEKNYVKAREYYKRAGKQGSAMETFAFWIKIISNTILRRKSKARKYEGTNLALLKKRAKKKDPEAFFTLGNLYYNGEGVRRDIIKARRYWARAITLGDPSAICALAASGEKTLTPPDSAASAEDGAAKEMASLSLASRADKDPFEISESHVSYNPEHALGRGSYGEVFKGLYHGAEVAIKFLRLSPSAFTECLLTGFREEAKMMAQLNHPNVVHFYGVTTIGSCYGLVMEYASRGSLYQVLHQKVELSWAERLQWGVEIGNGLAYLHEQQPERILHRDLKSPNVLISAGGQAKLTDFGVAMSKVRTQTQTLSTSGKSGKAAARAEDAVGSLRWMAPELFSLRPKYGIASDIYAFAIVLWELSSRALPYVGQADMGVIERAVKSGDREEISEDCPAELKEAIELGWAQDPAARTTAKELAEKLQASEWLTATSLQQPAPSQADLPLPGAAATIASSRGYAPLRTENPAESTASGYVLRTN